MSSAMDVQPQQLSPLDVLENREDAASFFQQQQGDVASGSDPCYKGAAKRPLSPAASSSYDQLESDNNIKDLPCGRRKMSRVAMWTGTPWGSNRHPTEGELPSQLSPTSLSRPSTLACATTATDGVCVNNSRVSATFVDMSIVQTPASEVGGGLGGMPRVQDKWAAAAAAAAAAQHQQQLELQLQHQRQPSQSYSSRGTAGLDTPMQSPTTLDFVCFGTVPNIGTDAPIVEVEVPKFWAGDKWAVAATGAGATSMSATTVAGETSCCEEATAPSGGTGGGCGSTSGGEGGGGGSARCRPSCSPIVDSAMEVTDGACLVDDEGWGRCGAPRAENEYDVNVGDCGGSRGSSNGFGGWHSAGGTVAGAAAVGWTSTAFCSGGEDSRAMGMGSAVRSHSSATTSTSFSGF